MFARSKPHAVQRDRFQRPPCLSGATRTRAVGNPFGGRTAGVLLAARRSAVVAIPLATSTEEGLEHNLLRTPAITTHARLGDELLVFAAPLLVCVFALAFLERRRRRGVSAARAAAPGTMTAPAASSARTRVAAVLLAALTVVFAVICAVQVFRIGDSGARAASSASSSAATSPPPPARSSTATG